MHAVRKYMLNNHIVTAVGTADAVWRMHDSCRCIVLQQKLGDPYNVMQSWAAREL